MPEQKPKQNVLNIISKEIIAGIQHGFFRCEIECEKLQQGKRQITLRAGKSHKFTISEEEAKNLQ